VSKIGKFIGIFFLISVIIFACTNNNGLELYPLEDLELSAKDYFEAGSNITPSRIFINGYMVAQQEEIIKIDVVLDIIYIGRSLSNENFNSTFFNGRIDDLRIYGRPLLETEIINLSNENVSSETK